MGVFLFSPLQSEKEVKECCFRGWKGAVHTRTQKTLEDLSSVQLLSAKCIWGIVNYSTQWVFSTVPPPCVFLSSCPS